MDWKNMMDWASGITGLVTTVLLTLLGAKAWRANRVDAAKANVAVAELEGEVQGAQLNTSAMVRMEIQLKEQSIQIKDLATKVSALEAEVHRLNSTNRTALDLLEEIKLCEECEKVNGVLLRTAIKHLRNADGPH